MTDVQPTSKIIQDRRHLTELINGFFVSQAIYASVTLGIPDILLDRPCTSDEIASLTGSHPASVYRLLRALAAVGILHESERRRFSLSDVGEGLASKAPASRNAWTKNVARSVNWASWGQLLHTVRTGETAFDYVHGRNIWNYRSEHPDDSAIFDAAMRTASRSLAEEVLVAYPFDGVTSVVDVGGGDGALLAGLLVGCENLRGILIDLPHVASDGAGKTLTEAGVRDRCEVVAGSFFESVPGAGDIYLLKYILHDWADAEARLILRKCREAMRPDGKILVVERLLAPPDEGAEGKLSDLNMMVNTGGRERTRDEFEALLASADLEIKDVRPLTNCWIIEASCRSSS